MINLKVEETNENQRLDKYLLKYLNKSTKSFIYKMLRKKNIKLNDKKALGNEILIRDDIISIYLSDDTINNFKEDKNIEKTKSDFKIIYEDENLIICYKPINLVSQPDKNNPKNSLNDQLIFYMYEKGEYKSSSDFTPSVCNRLDRNTSGIVIFGKNFKALQALNKALKENNHIDKYYLTVVNGNLKNKGKITLFHYKDKNNQAVVSKNYVKGAKEIITEYEPIKNKNNLTLLKVKLITGKSHQIRASFKYLGYPIIGDKKYNNYNNNIFDLPNQFLHCYKVTFNEISSSLSYLNKKTFVCTYLNKTYSKILNYFEYKIEE